MCDQLDYRLRRAMGSAVTSGRLRIDKRDKSILQIIRQNRFHDPALQIRRFLSVSYYRNYLSPVSKMIWSFSKLRKGFNDSFEILDGLASMNPLPFPHGYKRHYLDS